MKILKFEAENFRNVKKTAFSPSKKCNIFIGENGHGKTNLLEALCLFTGEKSFRRAKEADMIRFDEEYSELRVKFFSQEREQTAKIRFFLEKGSLKKQIELNGVKKRSASALNGVLCTVIFSPEDLRIIKDGPEERRRLIDTAVTQLIPSYSGLINSYQRTVFQRNSLLREISKSGRGLETLDVWDMRLAKLGAKIVKLRKHYIDRISPFAQKHYEGISGGKEKLTFSYISSAGETEEEFLSKLKSTRQKDIELCQTNIGPHRDDTEILLDSRLARHFGSQGQQRSVVLAMKLSEADVLSEKYGEPPVLLLDDVLSELDVNRQNYLIGKINKYQVFITCCEAHLSLKGRQYTVEKGRIRLRKEKKCTSV